MAPNARLSDAELVILKALWAHGPTTVRGLLDTLGEQGPTWAYTTVQTLVTRLQEKGYVTSHKDGRAFVYRPTLSQDELVGQHLDDLAERICDGSPAPLVWSLVQRGRLTRDDLAELRGLLDDLDGETKR